MLLQKEHRTYCYYYYYYCWLMVMILLRIPSLRIDRNIYIYIYIYMWLSSQASSSPEDNNSNHNTNSNSTNNNYSNSTCNDTSNSDDDICSPRRHLYCSCYRRYCHSRPDARHLYCMFSTLSYNILSIVIWPDAMIMICFLPADICTVILDPTPTMLRPTVLSLTDSVMIKYVYGNLNILSPTIISKQATFNSTNNLNSTPLAISCLKQYQGFCFSEHIVKPLHEWWSTHGSFLIRRQRGHPGVALPLVISNSANH